MCLQFSSNITYYSNRNNDTLYQYYYNKHSQDNVYMDSNHSMINSLILY